MGPIGSDGGDDQAAPESQREQEGGPYGAKTEWAAPEGGPRDASGAPGLGLPLAVLVLGMAALLAARRP